MYYIFIDESGQFSTQNDTKNFVIGSFGVNDNKHTYNKISAWFKNKFQNRKNEIKWSDTYISDKLRLKTLRYIKRLDIDINFAHINKIPKQYYSKGGLESGRLYVDLVIKALRKYNLKGQDSVYVYCDRRALKNIKIEEFIKIIKTGLTKMCSIGCNITVETINSHHSMNIQIADWLAGAKFRFLEKGHLWREILDIFEV